MHGATMKLLEMCLLFLLLVLDYLEQLSFQQKCHYNFKLPRPFYVLFPLLPISRQDIRPLPVQSKRLLNV